MDSDSNVSLPSGEAALKLENQLCFSLYAAARLVTRRYQPLLAPLGITYPQYIVLMVLWEDEPCRVSHLVERTLLNTNTLTPLLQKLEGLGYVTRTRKQEDERVVEIALTPKGRSLKEQCFCVPASLFQSMGSTPEEALQMKRLLDRLIAHMNQEESQADAASER